MSEERFERIEGMISQIITMVGNMQKSMNDFQIRIHASCYFPSDLSPLTFSSNSIILLFCSTCTSEFLFIRKTQINKTINEIGAAKPMNKDINPIADGENIESPPYNDCTTIFLFL
jgi:hypothetical protein